MSEEFVLEPWDDDDEEWGPDPDPMGMDEIGCCFPGKCVMPGEHFRNECATAEMMEEMQKPGSL